MWEDPDQQRTRALQERNELLIKATPEHEKSVAVRVATSAPTFEAKFPQERFMGIIMLPGILYALYYSLMFGAVAVGAFGVTAAVLLALLALSAFALLAVAVKKITLRPGLRLDAQGLHITGKRFIFFEGHIALENIQGFSCKVVRRSIDNSESWRVNVQLANGREVFCGASKTGDAAQEIVSELQQTLIVIRGQHAGYRVGT